MRAFIGLGLVIVGIVALTAGMVGADAAGDAAADIARLKAELEQPRGRLPDQSHVMKDVGDHSSNLWFAAGAKNWPLTKFYLDETRSHSTWAVRVNPVRKTREGTAAEKPYLGPKIPEQPETRIIDFEPSPAGRE